MCLYNPSNPYRLLSMTNPEICANFISFTTQTSVECADVNISCISESTLGFLKGLVSLLLVDVARLT